jgi:hypothetical protein
VWFLTGLWHGASWSFVLWGLLYFVLIAFEKLTGYPRKFKSGAARAGYRAFTLLAVLGGWVLFRAPGTGAAVQYGLTMLGLKGNPLFCDNVILTLREYGVFLLGALLCSTPLFRWLRVRVDRISAEPLRVLANAACACAYLFCFVWAVSFLVLGAHNPFIYFNF